MKATFIDCYAQGDDIVLWLKQGSRNVKVIDRFVPEIYARGEDLKGLRRKFLGKGVRSFFCKKKSFYGGKEISVLKVPVYKISRYHMIVRMLEKMCEYGVELYNADLKIEELYLFERGLFPTAKVEYEVINNKLKSIEVFEDAENVKYEIPKFVVCNLKIISEESLSKTLETKLLGIEYNGKKFEGSEENILLEFKKEFEEQDPDIIWMENGNLGIPYLKKKFETHRVSFEFNRFERDDFKIEKGESYWTYSQVVYRTASIFLKGRLHFDTRSFFADDTGFYGIIDGARVCRQRIQRVEMRSAGAAVTNLLLYESYRNGFLLPYKVGMYERFKTLRELYEADRGSMIFEPRVGFHKDVVEFDFVSLYPQIMWKKNLSPETLFCGCCVENKVPGLHYNYCKRKRGIVSIVAEKLINRRVELKKQGTLEAREKADYLKWLLVTMFGYQAFKNRKVGIIESHESIQAYAREIIMETVRVAESLGWVVVHGIVDSVYLKKKNRRTVRKEDVEKLEKEIMRKTGFKIAHEGNYRWIVFLPSVLNASQPISNHFYGVFEDGELKCRGIEIRRKDVPKIVVNLQGEIIESLKNVKNEKEFREGFGEAFKILRNYVKSLKYASKEELSITRRITKTEYINRIPQKILIEMLENEGWEVHPGEKISYIIRSAKNKNWRRRYILPEDFNGRFDRQKYVELMVRATFNILQPFGISERKIWEVLKGVRQMTLGDFAVEKIAVR